MDDTHLTHGVLFPGVNVFSQVSNSLCIFKAELHEWCDPNSRLNQAEKDRLDLMFGAILEELDLDKDKPTKYKAGKLNLISLNPSRHRRMTGIIAKHDNEWKSTRVEDFTQMMELYRRYGREEMAGRLAKRVQDLAISLKVNKFDTEKQTYYIHPLAMVGWFSKNETSELITIEQMLQIFPDGNKSLDVKQRMQLVIDELNSDLEGYKLDTPLRKAHFFAQVRIEAGPNFRFVENLKYGERNLIKNFGYYKRNPNEAKQDAYNEVAIANKAYADQNRRKGYKLGNTSPGDGYKYRGRGLK